MSSTLTDRTVQQPTPRVNTVLDDLVDAVESYPTDYLTIEIYDVEAPGGGINEFDDVTCKVHVHNSGPLEVTDLTLLIEARPGAEGVKLHGGAAFNPSLTSGPMVVPAHMFADTWVDVPEGHYHFKAGPRSTGEVELVRASIGEWNCNLNHPLIAHSDPAPSDNFVYSHHVLQG